jgi:hypothetical protein
MKSPVRIKTMTMTGQQLPKKKRFTALTISKPAELILDILPTRPITFEKVFEVNEPQLFRNVVANSFLERLFRHRSEIRRQGQGTSSSLSAVAGDCATKILPPDDLNVIIRFIIARIHTCFQLPFWQDPTSLAPVTNVSHLSGGLWLITTDHRAEASVAPQQAKQTKKGRRILIETTPEPENNPDTASPPIRQTFLVIGATGDVITVRDEPHRGAPKLSIEGFQLRPDWSTYITQILRSPKPDSTSNICSLAAQIQTKTGEDFPGGVARVWLNRAHSLGAHAEILVAKRYALSNVTLNRSV